MSESPRPVEGVELKIWEACYLAIRFVNESDILDADTGGLVIAVWHSWQNLFVEFFKNPTIEGVSALGSAAGGIFAGVAAWCSLTGIRAIQKEKQEQKELAKPVLQFMNFNASRPNLPPTQVYFNIDFANLRNRPLEYTKRIFFCLDEKHDFYYNSDIKLDHRFGRPDNISFNKYIHDWILFTPVDTINTAYSDLNKIHLIYLIETQDVDKIKSFTTIHLEIMQYNEFPDDMTNRFTMDHTGDNYKYKFDYSLPTSKSLLKTIISRQFDDIIIEYCKQFGLDLHKKWYYVTWWNIKSFFTVTLSNTIHNCKTFFTRKSNN